MPNSKRQIKVLGAGSPLLDILAGVSDDFVKKACSKKGGMELVDSAAISSILGMVDSQPSVAPGGSAANTIFGLARLGINTALLGKIGNDKDGETYAGIYRKMGGDTSRFKLCSDKHTGRCLSLITPDSERTMCTDLGAAALLTPADINAADFADISHVHAEGYLLYNGDLMNRILELAAEKSCIVSFDLSSFGVVETFKNSLPAMIEKYVDILFANEDEAKAFTGESDPEKALSELAKFAKTVAVKVGKKGAFLKDGNKKAKVDAIVVNAVDTTGAGDLWQAGFLYGFINGLPLDVCGSFGSILGAEVVQVVGAAIPEKRWPVIKAKLKS